MARRWPSRALIALTWAQGRGKTESLYRCKMTSMIARMLKDPLLVLAGCLLGASVYFALGVERMKTAIQHTDAAAFVDGQTVKITAIIDGDELTVQSDTGQSTVVRLLGIKSFRRASYDRLFGRFGRQSFDHLQSRWLNRPVRLIIGQTRVDERQRLLAYLESTDGPDPPLDIGHDLVQRGFSLVYTAYPFGREQAYLRAEDTAIADKRGLWANADMVARVRGLQAMWAERRQEGLNQ
ncbi:MAG: thermonuclease family protein [Myxococcota bacterium]|nr:thermonuclease family protein [Myxococcota bacterium]